MTAFLTLRGRRRPAFIPAACELAAAGFIAAALFGPLPAEAASQAIAAQDLNVRTGPGPQYQRSSLVPAGMDVSVRSCLAVEGWCRIDWAGGRGWVVQQYLVYTGRTDRNRRQPAPDINIDVGVPLSDTGTGGLGVQSGGSDPYGDDSQGYDRAGRPSSGGSDNRRERDRRNRVAYPLDPLDDAQGFPRARLSDGALPSDGPGTPRFGRPGDRRDPSGTRQYRYDQDPYDRDRPADDRTGLARPDDDDLGRGDPRYDDRPSATYRYDDDRAAALPAVPRQRTLPSGTVRRQRQVATDPNADSTGVTGGSILNSRPLIQDGDDLLSRHP